MGNAKITNQTGNKLNYDASEITVMSEDSIQIGDTVYTVTGDVKTAGYFTGLNGYVYAAAFSPDGNILVLGGAFIGRAKRYAVSGTSITYTTDIYADAGITALNNMVVAAAFSPDGSTLVLGGMFTGYAKRYTVPALIRYLHKAKKLNPTFPPKHFDYYGIAMSNALPGEDVIIEAFTDTKQL